MSTLLDLRTLLESQIDSEVTDSGTDPSSVLLNQYLNISIRKIARNIKPRELMLSTPIVVDMTFGQNSVTLPNTVLVPYQVYITSQSTQVYPLIQKNLKDIIAIEGGYYFDSSNTGDSYYYDVVGNSIVFNKYFKNSTVGGIKIFGIVPPINLINDIDVSSLTVDYDLVTVYEAAVLFYQRDDDVDNMAKYQQLALKEISELKLSLLSDNQAVITMDPNVYGYNRWNSIANPSFLFGSHF